MCATQPTWFLLKAPVAELPAALGIMCPDIALAKMGLLGAALRWMSIVCD